MTIRTDEDMICYPEWVVRKTSLLLPRLVFASRPIKSAGWVKRAIRADEDIST